MYLLVATYAGHNFDECDLYANSHVIGIYETVEECKEAAQNNLKEFLTDSADNYCDGEDSDSRVKKYVKDRIGSMVLYDLDDSNFTRPYVERNILEYSREESYGLDVIKYLVIGL